MKNKPAADGILAIVVGRSTSDYLQATLEAAAEGTRRPDRLTLVLLDEGEVDVTGYGIPINIVRSQASTAGEAFTEGLDDAAWIWLLHDDSAPSPNCLADLHRTSEASKAIAAAGPKQVGWEDPSELLEVGIRATRSGRRVPELDPGEKDQGQFDSREDVLAVGTAGMLLRADALNEAGGFDPALGPFGDGLELSRRLRAAGHRVVVVPSAIVKHARQSYEDTAQSFGRRRGSQMYTALQRAPLLVVPFLFLLYVLLSPVRALARLAIKDTIRARGELWAGIALLGKLGSLIAARRRLRKATVTRSYRSLEATHRDVTTSRADIRKARKEAKKLRSLPPADERREAAERRARTRASAVALSVITFVGGIVAFLPNLPALGLTGGGLLPDDSTARELLSAATSSWSATGDGYAGHLEPIWLLAVPLVYLAGLFGASLTEVILLFFIAAPMLAGLSAFRASGAVANSPAVRFVIGAVWAAAPPLLASLSAGQAGAVLFHIALPLFIVSMARAVMSRFSSHLGSAAWWTLLIGAAYPGFLVAAILFAVVVAIGQRRIGWLWVPLPAAALTGPALWQTLKTLPDSLAQMPGAVFDWSPGERWEILAGWPLGIDRFETVVAVALGIAVLGAALSLLRVRRSGGVQLGWLIVGLGGILTAFLLSETAGIDRTTLTEAAAWPGPGLSIILVGLLLALAAGAHGLRADLSQTSLSVRHVLAGVCALGLVAVPLSSAAVWLTGIHTGSDTHVVQNAPGTLVPALSAKNATDPAKGRTLVLSPNDGGYRAELWRGNGPQLTEHQRLTGSGEPLANAVTRIGENDFAELISHHAVTVILVPGEGTAERDLGAMLDSTESITRVTGSEIGTFWRVDIPSGRVMQDGEVLPSGVYEAAADAQPGTLYLAERANPKWVAVQDGIELEPADDKWRAAWQVETAGEVHISHEGGFGQWWITLIRALIIIGNITVSLPWRVR